MSSVAGEAEQVRPQPRHTLKPILILTALGVVYGDIGTSPLYVFQAIAQTQGGRLDAQSALGSFSLIFWTLIIVVTIKYSLVVMSADNHGAHCPIIGHAGQHLLQIDCVSPPPRRANALVSRGFLSACNGIAVRSP